MEDLSDTHIRANLRTILAEAGIDPNRTTFTCTSGTVRVLGDLLGVHSGEPVRPSQIDAMESSIRKAKGVTRLHLHLEHWERSPLRLVGNVTTPTLLITGELDLRTPMAQTEEYYQALKLRKVDTAMVRIPDEYHGAAGRHVSNRLRRILYVRSWFEKYTPEEEDPPETVEAVEAVGTVSK